MATEGLPSICSAVMTSQDTAVADGLAARSSCAPMEAGATVPTRAITPNHRAVARDVSRQTGAVVILKTTPHGFGRTKPGQSADAECRMLPKEGRQHPGLALGCNQYPKYSLKIV
jgi:hypothetical protein